MRIYNANPGFGTPMTEEEIKNFLVTADKLNVHIAYNTTRFGGLVHYLSKQKEECVNLFCIYS